MITESQFKTCARAFFSDCIFEKGKNSNYDYNIIKFNHDHFVIKFVDCSVIIQRGSYFSHYPYICFCEEHLCSVLKKIKNYPNWSR
jgi:hypothetical protein